MPSSRSLAVIGYRLVAVVIFAAVHFGRLSGVGRTSWEPPDSVENDPKATFCEMRYAWAVARRLRTALISMP